MSKKTVTQVVAFVNAAARYRDGHDGEETSLDGHIRNIEKKQVPAIYEDYNDALSDARRDNAACGPTGVILREPNGDYSYTHAGEKKKELDIRAANKKLYDIQERIPVNVDAVMDYLTSEEKIAFAGFVIPEIEEED